MSILVFLLKPYKEKVGTGASQYETYLETDAEIKEFLLSKDSCHVYANAVDLSNLAKLFKINIAVFTYSSRGLIVPYWSRINPVPKISAKNKYANLGVKEMWLFNDDQKHYNLLMRRPHHQETMAKPQVQFRRGSEEESSDEESGTSSYTLLEAPLPPSLSKEKEGTVFSHMDFMKC